MADLPAPCMRVKTIVLLTIFLAYLPALGQGKKNVFKLKLINHSGYATTAAILGHDQADSVAANQAKTIVFDLPADQVSFYLNLWTMDETPASYRSKLIRVLNTHKFKQITIDTAGRLQYALTPSEQIIADYNPGLRTKNFWKLDTIIQNNADDIAAAEIIYLSICDIDVKVDTIKHYYDFLAPKIKSSPYGKRITEYLAARNRLNLGNKIDNFTLPDSTGKSVSLNAIKSDYILLDFWFSRCAPCIKSFPELQGLYEKTPRSKLEIVGISIDQAAEKQLWLTTLSKHNLAWINVNDRKTTVARKFAIVNYPTKILLDKNRRIVLIDTDNSYQQFYKEVEKLVNQ